MISNGVVIHLEKVEWEQKFWMCHKSVILVVFDNIWQIVII